MPLVRSIPRRWLRRLQAVSGFVPFTLLGASLTAVAVYFLVAYAIDESDLLLLAGCALALTWVGLSVLTVALGALLIRLRLRGSSHRAPDVTTTKACETGRAIETGLRIPRLRFLPLLEIDHVWDAPSGVEATFTPDGAELVETAVPMTRGRVAQIRRRFTVSDLFGLSKISFFHVESRVLEVAPHKGSYRFALALRNAAGDGFSHPKGEAVGEFIEMRRYAPGDPLKHVIWKAFARTRRLLVRTPERALDPKPSTVAYLVAGTSDDEAASTARLFVEDGLLGEDSIFSAAGAARPARDAGEALDQIISSVDHRADEGAGLSRFLGQVNRHQLGHCVVFAPRESGPWVEEVVRFSRALPTPATVILSADITLPEAPRPRWRRLLFGATTPPDHETRRLTALHAELSGHGLEVRILHTGRGEEIPGLQLEALGAV